MSSLGSMSQKIVVRASDDVFDDTKKKMTLAEEESKKQWYVVHVFYTSILSHSDVDVYSQLGTKMNRQCAIRKNIAQIFIGTIVR